MITAGAPLAAETACRFREAFGLPVHVFYGASECGGICYDRRAAPASAARWATPVEGVSDRPAAARPGARGGGRRGRPGAAGVVAVASPAVAAGYVPEPEARLAGGASVAGDLAVWVAGTGGGELELRGRLDDLINVKGKKVDPREVEGVLARLPGVAEAAVLGIPMPGREGEVVRAVVACPAGRLTVEAVVAWCREHLAAHKVPRSVMLLPDLPRTARGKLDRAALRALPAGGLAPRAGASAGASHDPEA